MEIPGSFAVEDPSASLPAAQNEICLKIFIGLTVSVTVAPDRIATHIGSKCSVIEAHSFFFIVLIQLSIT